MSAGHTPHGSGQWIIDTKRHFRNVYNSVSELLAKSSAVVDLVLRVPVTDVTKRDGSGGSVLHWLCWFSDDRNAVEPAEVLARLLREPGIEVDAHDKHG